MKGKERVAPEGAYALQTEYYRIDLIAWRQRAKRRECYNLEGFSHKLKKHSWSFDLAVEQENESSDWSDEVIKLAYICSELRVVIGYLPFLSRKGVELIRF